MQSYYPPTFAREMGCTDAELRQWLAPAVPGLGLAANAGRAEAPLGAGRFVLEWEPLPPRRIALIVMPRLAVRFAFPGVDDATRQAFMKRFDLHMQRGGG